VSPIVFKFIKFIPNPTPYRSTRIALHAADLYRQYKLATADAVVYATTREFDAELLTCDAHFENLPGVVFVKKNG